MLEKVQKIFESEASALKKIPVDDSYEKVTKIIF